ncbi:hypothetical protein HQ524_02025 [Candidatus Uhrbacteria bacterium]|nr:hypothetical protein [Candidatus Uhrbacteria bacterium]
MGKGNKNLVFAFELPEAAIRTIESLQHDLQRHIRGPLVRWTSPEAWHVITHKADNVSEKTAQNLRDAMSLFRKEPVSFTLWALDVFPNVQNPKKLVLRLADPTATGFNLHGSHVPMLLREAVEVNARPWQPHITLGSIAGGRSGFNANLSSIHVPQETFQIPKLTLFEYFRDSSVRYEPIRKLSLPRT